MSCVVGGFIDVRGLMSAGHAASRGWRHAGRDSDVIKYCRQRDVLRCAGSGSVAVIHRQIPKRFPSHERELWQARTLASTSEYEVLYVLWWPVLPSL
jgi:hypothetical protein